MNVSTQAGLAPHPAGPQQTVSRPVGTWRGASVCSLADTSAARPLLHDIRRPAAVVLANDEPAIGVDGVATIGDTAAAGDGFPLLAAAPAMGLNQLGDAGFCQDHRIKVAYKTGAMANGIASADIVIAMAKAGMLGSFGSAGLSIERVTQAIDRIQSEVGDLPYCFNLIHSPNEPQHEARVVELYIQRGVKLVEASAYLDLTLPAVRYRVHGIHRDGDGRIVTPNRIIAKASRIEVATKWFSPPPQAMLDELIQRGDMTAEQAELARQVPMAQDLTAEADSGGHTDNRPAITLIPTFIALRDRMQQQYGDAIPLRVGAAGGIATPASAAAAFAMGAAYIVTGSVNQACVESGSSDIVRKMLAQTEQADVTMAPAADMFEMGVKLQVLKRGTMFPMRAAKLFETYRKYNSLDEIPPAERASLEKTVFRQPIDDIWRQTREFFMQREPTQAEKADRDLKHRMALVFRWYLGLSSRWANTGEASRQLDYQIWCGPAMGAFNEWTKGSPLEAPEGRTVQAVALNILYGAGVTTRLNMLRSQGITLSADLLRVEPQPVSQLQEFVA